MTEPEFLARPDGARLAYRRRKGASPGIVFIGGFMSDMTGTKASFLDEFAAKRKRAFLRFDLFAHGASSGAFRDATVGRWRDDVLAALDELSEGPQIVVGSSLGGWLMLHAALARPDRVAALVGIAAAPDATALMWDSFPKKVRRTIKTKGEIALPSGYGDAPYIFTRTLIQEGRKHLLTGKPIPIMCPVRLLQGVADPDVPWRTSLKLARKLKSDDVEITFVKDGDHRLSRPRDLDLLARTIDALL